MKSDIHNGSASGQLAFLLKWGKITAKIAALGTTLTGAITTFTTSSTAAGIAMGAAGATTFAATKDLEPGGYEKTRHIPPGAPIRVNSASRAILEAATHKKLAFKEAPSAKESVLKPGPSGDNVSASAAMHDEPFSWVDEEPVAGPQTEEAQAAFAFFRRPPVMVVTTQQEDEFDEKGERIKRIKRSALNFLTSEEDEKMPPQPVDGKPS